MLLPGRKHDFDAPCIDFLYFSEWYMLYIHADPYKQNWYTDAKIGHTTQRVGMLELQNESRQHSFC
jgi:hypothetical protein